MGECFTFGKAWERGSFFVPLNLYPTVIAVEPVLVCFQDFSIFFDLFCDLVA
jgi:hypothetical protein